jgi:hypothetical protein
VTLVDKDLISTELQKQLLARLGIQVPATYGVHGVSNATNSPATQEFKQSPITHITDEKEFLLLTWFREFNQKDEAKVLASELGKFARFVQSESAKSSKVKEVIPD